MPPLIAPLIRYETEARTVGWRVDLERRCERFATRVDQALRISPDLFGALPSPDEVASGLGAQPPARAPSIEGAEELRSLRGLEGLRAAIVPGLVRELHTVLLETGKEAGQAHLLHQSFGLADLLADERYKLYECFDRKGLLDLLDRLRESGMEMLACAP
jgi:hypothetical protein